MPYYISPKYGIIENNFKIKDGPLIIKLMYGKKMFLNCWTYCHDREAERNIFVGSPNYQQRRTKNLNHMINNLETLSKPTEIKRYAITPMITHCLVFIVPVITNQLRKYSDFNNSEPRTKQRRMVWREKYGYNYFRLQSSQIVTRMFSVVVHLCKTFICIVTLYTHGQCQLTAP